LGFTLSSCVKKNKGGIEMKFAVRFKVLVMAVVCVLVLAGNAWASPYLLYRPTNMAPWDDGRGYISDGGVFRGYDLRLEDAVTNKEDGSIKLTTNGTATLVFKNAGNGAVIPLGEIEINAATDFELYEDEDYAGRYYFGNDSANYVLCTTPDGLASFEVTGSVGAISSTLFPQTNDFPYVPYIEPLTDPSGKLTGVHWELVDPSNPDDAIVKSGADGLGHLRVSFSYTTRGFVSIDDDDSYTFPTFSEGDSIEDDMPFNAASDVALDDILLITMHIEPDTTATTDLYVEHDWIFVRKEDFDMVKNLLASQVDEATVKADAQKNGISMGTVKNIEADSVDAKTIIDGSMAATVKMTQHVGDGNALAVKGGNITLPYPDGTSLPPLNASDYTLFKYFEPGVECNLAALTPDRGADNGVVEIDVQAKTAKLLPTLVIIDDEAPADAQWKKNSYGVTLSSDKQYLYVWDGEKNGVADDPINFGKGAGPASVTDSGGGGCDTGAFGLIGLAMAGLIAAAKGKKRG
jgi:hypothetical protein